MIDMSVLPLSLSVVICFVAGLLLGFAYFSAVRMTVNLVLNGGHPLLGLALTFGRFAGLAAGFYLAVLAGGLCLLAALAGVLCAKALILNQTRKVEA